MRIPRSHGDSAEIGHIRGVISRTPRNLLLVSATAIVLTAGGVGIASASPGQPSSRAGEFDRGNSPARGGGEGGNGRGNGGRGDGNGGRGDGNGGRGNGGGNPIITTPSVPRPPAPVTPGAPVAPRNPIVPPSSGGSSGRAPGGPAATGGSAGDGGSASGSGQATGGQGARTTTTPSAAVPRSMPTSGMSAGRRGAVDVSYFVDLGDLPSATAHLTIVPTVLARMAAGSLGTVTLRPLMTGRDANSTEAACALVAASQQNRAWQVAQSLATARTTIDGDWLSTATLRSIGKRISGIAVSRFVRDATGRTCYRQLTAVRAEARASRVGSSPAFVVTGPGGTTVVMSPGSADDVMGAVAAVG